MACENTNCQYTSICSLSPQCPKETTEDFRKKTSTEVANQAGLPAYARISLSSLLERGDVLEQYIRKNGGPDCYKSPYH